MPPSAELALHRFGYGARPGEVASVGGDPKGWLATQVKPQPEPDYFKPFPGTGDTWRGFPDRQAIRVDAALQAKFLEATKVSFKAQMEALIQSAATTATPFFERLVWFWANHLSITAGAKSWVTPLCFDYFRSAIRPHVTGKFADLLIASARHPAMLMFLDNAISTGPHSRAGIANKTGINENYAREVMELHTLGVKGGYTQTDVQELAKILTGWSLHWKPDFQGDPYIYQDALHEPGPKTLLGVQYEAGGNDGEAAGVAALQALARHPSTGKRLAQKFATHFVSDNPPPSLTDRLAKVYGDTDGDLGEMARALVNSDEAWQVPLVKARDAFQFMVAGMRLIGHKYPLDPALGAVVWKGFNTSGEVPFHAPTPQGWPDTVESQFGPDQVVNRAEWAQAAATQAKVQTNPADIAKDVLGSLLSPVTESTIALAPSPSDGLALLIASPEVMRR